MAKSILFHVPSTELIRRFEMVFRRYSIRTLLIGFFLIGCALAPIARMVQRASTQRHAVRCIEDKLGGIVGYDNERYRDGAMYRMLCGVFDEHYFASVDKVKILAHENSGDADYGCLALLPKLALLDAFDATDFDDRDLAQLTGLGRLRGLSLDGTSITDEGLEAAGKIKALRRLTLRDTKISDRGFESILANCDLESLDISGTKVEIRNVAALLLKYRRDTLVQVSADTVISKDGKVTP